MSRHAPSSSDALLERLEQARAWLTPAEGRVAACVLDDPRHAVRAPVAQIAGRAGVSQPMVIRFCRSVGFAGLTDFKIALAARLANGEPPRHEVLSPGDSVQTLAVKLLGNAAAGLARARDQLNPGELQRAVDWLAHAQRVDCYGIGLDSMVAEHAQRRLIEIGIPSLALQSAHDVSLGTQVAGPGAVALFVGLGARIRAMAEWIARAPSRGMRAVVLTDTPLPAMQPSRVVLMLDSAGRRGAEGRMINHVLQLVTIDILASAVGRVRRSTGAVHEVAA